MQVGPLGRYDDTYMSVFAPALEATLDVATDLSDDELERLARYSGIVGLAAEHVLFGRSSGVARPSASRG